jgi:hypothetical protein
MSQNASCGATRAAGEGRAGVIPARAALAVRSWVRGRELEWFLALQTAAQGAWILSFSEAMAGGAYAALRASGGPAVWGGLLFAAGAAHVGALVVNGRRARATTAIRAVITAGSVVAFVAFALGFAEVRPYSTAVETYFAFAGASAAAFYRALRDAHRARRPVGGGEYVGPDHG